MKSCCQQSMDQSHIMRLAKTRFNCSTLASPVPAHRNEIRIMKKLENFFFEGLSYMKLRKIKFKYVLFWRCFGHTSAHPALWFCILSHGSSCYFAGWLALHACTRQTWRTDSWEVGAALQIIDHGDSIARNIP